MPARMRGSLIIIQTCISLHDMVAMSYVVIRSLILAFQILDDWRCRAALLCFTLICVCVGSVVCYNL
ncbi:hypothetical protein GW17_00034679 [Ensete ventricosum]|uniref:Uncharacterized protein n=1 Tax=Ensete ventricosum TaxID=4639 RepID=A0A444DVS7_ENSVE|nr:hypothetical protein B296_00057691 [Ensete ventricosum]RWW02241.1 hypothetical protein GW17_00034679 [Ensete ventricosum]RZR89479.1 hypothetical protein BHM03_00017210 [Ensete ventricosum]